MNFIGVDNGVSGSIAVLNDDGDVLLAIPTPVKQAISYTKKIQNITRIAHYELTKLLEEFGGNCRVAIERPMVNPGRFKATASALRALESMTIIMEHLQMPYEFLDSKEWQRVLLPQGVHKEELKKASIEVAKRLFPTVEAKPDGDGLLIAEWLRRRYR